MHFAVQRGDVLGAEPSNVLNARCGQRWLHLGTSTDEKQSSIPSGPAYTSEDVDRVAHTLLRHHSAYERECHRVITTGLGARANQSVVVAEWDGVDKTAVPLAAKNGSGLSGAGVEPGHPSQSSAFPLRERWRPALVQVLGRVHDDGRASGDRKADGKALPGYRAERLLVEVKEVGLDLCQQASELGRVGVAVAVDVSGPLDGELRDRIRLVQATLTRWPHLGDHERDVDAGRSQGPLAPAVRWVAPGVVDAHDAQRRQEPNLRTRVACGETRLGKPDICRLPRLACLVSLPPSPEGGSTHQNGQPA